MSGEAGVVAEAISGGAAEIAGAPAAEELPLFALPGRAAPIDAPARERAIEARKRGRPPGAVNRSTKELREYLLRRGVNPLQAMMEWALHSPESLSRELGCTPLEAFDRLKSLWEALAPYIAPRMVAVDEDGQALPLLQLVIGGQRLAPSAGSEPPWITQLRQIEQNQQVSGAPADVSHASASHQDEKS